ncbi:MAG: gliding motility-associated-like protein [Sphingobacteriales bacterium]|jgi:gliding motility-associated-like protein
MKKIFTLITLVALTTFFSNNELLAQDNKGTEFWFTMPAQRSGIAAELKLYFIGYYDTEIKIEYPARAGQTGSSTTLQLTGGIPLTFNMPQAFLDGDFRYERVQQNGLVITSAEPIAVYAINYEAASSEIAPIPPVDKLGLEYYTTAYREITSTSNDFNARVQIVGTQDNTEITVTMPSYSWGSKVGNQGLSLPPDTSITFTLNRGETYLILCNDNGMGLAAQVRDAGTVGNNFGLNGAHIVADKKIAVVGGSDCTWIGNKQYPGCGACDLTFTPHLPVEQWSKRFITTQTLSRGNNLLGGAGASIADYLMIIAKDDNTVVTIGGKAAATKTLMAGEYWRYESPGSNTDPNNPGATHHVVTSTNPISVVQMQKGWQCDNNNAADPSQMWVFGEETWVNNYIVTNPSDGAAVYPFNFIVFLAKETDLAAGTARSSVSLSANGVNVPVPEANWVQIGNTEYYFNRVPVAAGFIKIIGDSAFAFYASGSGGPGSYGYMGGVACAFEAFASADVACEGDPTTFTVDSIKNGNLTLAGPTYQAPSYTWYPDINDRTITLTEANPTYIYPSGGTYTAILEMTDVAGCPSIDTFEVNVVSITEVPGYTGETSICEGEDITLTGTFSATSITYTWWDAAVGGNQVYQGNPYVLTAPTPSGTVWVQIETANCESGRAEIPYTVLPSEVLDAPTLNCGSSTTSSISFTWNTITGADEYEVSLDNGIIWISPSTGAAGTTHDIAGLTQGDERTIRVRALKIGSVCGEGLQSAAVTCIAIDCPALAVQNTPDFEIINGTSGDLEVISVAGGSGNYSYSWDNGLAATAGPHTVTPGVTTTYTVTVADSDVPACPSAFGQTIVTVVNPEGYYFVIPDAFSPNGDNVNDIFLGKGEGVVSYSFKIFNRWGENIFSTEDITQGWDGKKDGVEVKTGVYLYVVKASNGADKNETYRGSVSLTR